MAKSCTKTYTLNGLANLLGNVGRTLHDRSEEVTFLAQPGAMLCVRADCRGRILTSTGTTSIDANGNVLSTVAVCPKCAFMVCLDCRSDAHEGMTCIEAATRKSSATPATNEIFLNHVTKRCPNCKLRIYKQGIYF